MSETCALCLQQKPLRDSHIIPKFVGKWLKDTSATGFLASADDASKRKQDLVKEKLLCEYCEQKFSKFENYFANNIFYPFHNDKVREFDYDENLKPFIISMAWRVLVTVKEEYLEGNFASPLNSFVNKAEKEWRKFLNGDVDSIDQYETHVVFLDYLKPDSIAEADSKFHWYLLRGADSDICSNDTRVFLYVKLPWMAFVVAIEPQKLEGWEGTIINKSGCITTGQKIADGEFAGLLQNRANLAMTTSSGPDEETSARRLQQAIEKNPERFFASDILQALIEEGDLVRKEKMKNMPGGVKELVEHAILTGQDDPNLSRVENGGRKLATRRIADIISNLSEEDVKRLYEVLFTVNRMSQILKENKEMTFTSDSIHITYLLSYDTNLEIRRTNVEKKSENLKVQTKEKIPLAVFSYCPMTNTWLSIFFIPPVIE